MSSARSLYSTPCHLGHPPASLQPLLFAEVFRLLKRLRGVVFCSEHPPHTEVTGGDLTTRSTSHRRRGAKGHLCFEMPPKRHAASEFSVVQCHFRFVPHSILRSTSALVASLPLDQAGSKSHVPLATSRGLERKSAGRRIWKMRDGW